MEDLLTMVFEKNDEDARDIRVLSKRSVFGWSEVMQQAKLFYDVMPAGWKVIIHFDYQRPVWWKIEKD